MKFFVKAKFPAPDGVSEPRVVKKHCADRDEAFAFTALMFVEGAISVMIRPEHNKQ